MQYDFVREAGIEPHSTIHWGLRSQEGYDVPTSVYSDDEFRQIVQYAQKILSKNGFTNVIGYRAGGWFIRQSQLDILGSLGFAYDSSGRDKPENGAFKDIPWNLSRGAQPYTSSNIFEIPNNGASTFEQSQTELVQRISDVFTSGILNTPKSLVFVSHPQFASKEFIKIPSILSTMLSQSEIRDSGPIVFTTMSDIYSAWNSR
jgi:hypothetical protein